MTIILRICLFSVVFILGAFFAKFIPESPRYFVNKSVISVPSERLQAFDFKTFNEATVFIKGSYESRHVIPECIVFPLDDTHIQIVIIAESRENLTSLMHDNNLRLANKLEAF